MKCLIFAFILVFVFKKSEEAAPRKLPAHIRPCPRTSSKNRCIIDNIESTRPYLKTGIPKLGIPSLDPLIIPQVSYHNERLKVSATNLRIRHLENFHVQYLDSNLEKGSFEIGLGFPRFEYEAKYWYKASLYFLQLNGTGVTNGNISNCNLMIYMKGNYTEQDGRKYLQLEKTGANVHFQNLLQNNYDRLDAILHTVDENFNKFVQEVQLVIEHTVGTLVVSVVKKVFSRYSVDELFPV